MSDTPIDPTPWHELHGHLVEAARLFTTLRREHGERLDFKHYSKLQFAERAVENFAKDVELVSGTLSVEWPRK